VTVALSILPIFVVIAIGLGGARLGFLPPQFIKAGNRLAFYLAIPALLFRTLATAPFAQSFQPSAALAALAALVITWLVAVAVSRPLHRPEQAASRATWIQGATHGNQGFLGLAVVFYGLGPEGLRAAGLIAAVIIVGQNLLSVVTLTRWGHGQGGRSLIKAMALNPIILATLAGLAWSLAGLGLPWVLDRTLAILAGLGLPLALLIVGATLSQSPLDRGRLARLGLLSLTKLLFMPALGWLLLWGLGVAVLPAAVALVLLSSPSATICVIMANQMGGDARLASTAISATHALSALTYILWLVVGSHLG